ncbi:MAG TPA: hypothetical protein VD866_29020, partial [Urbifossiella sp.]|nr:hypothetical protein [Urbifossiella sp.]
KPDGLAFGGTSDDPYWVPSLSNPGQSFAVMGTSFAAPSVMRAAVGVRAAFGPETDALVLKALHIHKTERAGHLPQTHQGWGRFCTIVPELVECVDSSYTVIYKGTIAPKRYLRLDVAVLPRFTGQVDLKATLCFAAQVDPQNAASYTRAAVDIVFRKNKLDIPEGKTTPPPSPFFGLVSGMTEAQRRADARKWEVTQHADQRYEDGGELVSPVFDLHYVPREDGRDDDDAPEIPFAMIISVSAPNHPKAHRDIEQRYTGVMNQLKPVIDLNLYV